MFKRNDFDGVALPKTAVTDDMAAAIDAWEKLYTGNAEWLNASNRHLSLGLASAVSREVSNMVTLEAGIDISDPNQTDDGEPSPRVKLMRDAMDVVKARLARDTEYACALGGLVYRPYIDGNAIAVDSIRASGFYPTAFNARGEITGAVFVERKRQNDNTYIRTEQHEMGDNGAYIIRNRAFKAMAGNSDMGTPCALTEVPEWAEIQPEIQLSGIFEPLFAYFPIPNGNVIDPDSPLGVSVFARAYRNGNLREADRQYQSLSWEYEAGEMAIDATIDSFRLDDNKRPILPAGKERLYRINEIGSDSDSSGRFSIFAPTLRDASYSAGLNKILQRIEDDCGLARGVLSDVNDVARTATEISMSRQRSYVTVSGIQKSLENALNALAKAMDTIITLYDLAPESEWMLSCKWDDSIVMDADSEREKDRQDVLDGLMQAWEYRVKWYGESEEKAKAALENAVSPMQRAISEAFGAPEDTEE